MNFLKNSDRQETLYNALRPKKFKDIYGQDSAVRLFVNSIVNKTFFHAYIIWGKHGIGKTSFARIIAKGLNCSNFTDDVCGECYYCCYNGLESNKVEIDGATFRGVNEMKSILEEMKYVSMVFKYRVLIIDEAQQLTNDAFSSMLKFIEEPPKHVIIIFLTTEIESILDTIKSRCNIVKLYPLNEIQIENYFNQVVEKNNNLNFNTNLKKYLCKSSQGSIRDLLVGVQTYLSLDDKSDDDSFINFETEINFESLYEMIVNRKIDEIISMFEGFFEQGWNVKNFFYSFLKYIYKHNKKYSIKLNSIFYGSMHRMNSMIEEYTFWIYIVSKMIGELDE